MIKIDLSDYKSSLIYFSLFDVLLNDLGESKEKYLKQIGINPSTYRKCKKGSLKIGPKVTFFLTSHFSLKKLTNHELDELAKFFASIYEKMYYKIEDTYEKDLKLIDEMIEENYVIFPIVKLMKLLLNICSNKAREVIIEENKELYEEVKRYALFFNDSVNQVYDIVNLFFEENIDENRWLKNYKDGFAYYILAARSYTAHRYVEGIFFAEKSKELLDIDGNIVRKLNVNNILMCSLLYAGNYEECNELARKQLLSIRAIGTLQSFYRKSASKYLFVSLLGLEEYEEILELCESKQYFNLTELTCYLVAMNRYNKKKYNTYFKSLNLEAFDEKDRQYIIMIDKYLRNDHRKVLKDLYSYDVMDCLINML